MFRSDNRIIRSRQPIFESESNSILGESLIKKAKQLIVTGTLKENLEFAKEHPDIACKYGIETFILESNDVNYNYLFARYVKNADIKAHEKIVLKSKDAYNCVKFAINVPNANVEAHMNVILKSKDYKICYEFIKHFSQYDITKFEKVVLDSKDVEYNYLFAKNIKGADIKAHEKIVIESENPIICYQFAKDVINADIKSLESIILNNRDSEFNFLFAKDVKGADIKAHEKIVINKGSAEFCYQFAKDIKNADIKALEKVVINSGNAEYCYKFAKDINCANVNAMAEVVLKSNNAKINYYFARDINFSDIKRHREIVEKFGDKNLLKEFDEKVKSDYEKLKSNYSQSDLYEKVNDGKTNQSVNNVNEFIFKPLSNDELLSVYVQNNKSVFLHGPSGVGKSARVKQLDPTATRITLRPQMNPEEVDGTLNRETGEYIPPLWYIQLCEKCEKEPERKHILFIDELTNVKPTVQSLVYSIVLDRAGKDGLWPLPKNAVVVAAGNESQGNLAAYPLTNALFRRFNHIYYEIDKDSWLNWAMNKFEKSNNTVIHPAILAYIMCRDESILNQELNEENPHIVTDPRKWEMASEILYQTKNPYALLPAIGETLTADFVSFAKSMRITVQQIINEEYNKDDFITLDISQKYGAIAGLTFAREEELPKVREFIKDNLGKELLATYDTLWIRNDPERAMIIGELRENKKYKEKEM